MKKKYKDERRQLGSRKKDKDGRRQPGPRKKDKDGRRQPWPGKKDKDGRRQPWPGKKDKDGRRQPWPRKKDKDGRRQPGPRKKDRREEAARAEEERQRQKEAARAEEERQRREEEARAEEERPTIGEERQRREEEARTDEERQRREEAARVEEERQRREEEARVEEERPSVREMDTLYKAICEDKWEIAKALLEKHPNALTSKITASGKTPFHVAALFGHVNITVELLKLLEEDSESLETALDDFGNTPLLIATATGITQVAKCLVEKNSRLLAIPNTTNELPTTLAFLSGHYEMGRYLYSQTPLECLQPYNDRPLGTTLLRCCLETQCFDIAHDLLSRCQELLFGPDEEDWKPIYGIATMTSTIPSPTEFAFWERWIYYYVDTNSTPSFESASLPIQHKDPRERAQGKLTGPAGHRLLRWLISSANNFIGIKRMKEIKLLQAEANELVELVCKNAGTRDQVSTFADALFRAAKVGNVEFVVQISKANPEILLIGDTSFRNIFHHAIKNRQARVFNLIHGLRFKDVFASSRDKNGNSLLHAAARRAPSTHLNQIYGPTLQMQSELQWFKEVEKLIPATIRKARNNDGMTADELFKEKHKRLMKQGEEWIKAMATSCSVVGSLVVTIMFTAAFTVPGGNDQIHGFPIFITQPFYKVFIFSTILSLVSSTTSVLMFLTIFTSHFSKEKFLMSLPTKLILGLSSLLISIVTMMIAFLSTIRLMFKHTSYSWSLLPVIMLASVPISVFVLSLFPLLRHSVFATYGRIFSKKVDKWP